MKRRPQTEGPNPARSASRRRGPAGYLAIIILKLAAIPVIALGTGLSIYLRTSPYPPTEALMHLVARGGCPAAAAVGLAPARQGALGYHAHNDIDGNGVACGQESEGSGTYGSASQQRAGGAKFIRPGKSGG